MESSRQLKSLKWYKELAGLKNRVEAGDFIVEGERAVAQIIDGFPEYIIEILTTERLSGNYQNYPVRVLTEPQLKSISTTKTPQGIMAVIKLPEQTYSDNLPVAAGDKILLLEDIQDPGNVGTLIRTAAAFDFTGIILSDKCADPFSPKCVQSTAGTLLSLWLRRTGNYLELVDTMRDSGYKLIAADLKGTENPAILRNNGQFMLALGNEAAGLSGTLLAKADFRLRIPINRNKAESLNVAVSGAICMYLSSQGQ
jgi:TrmH family RNA methyltransferase